MLLPGGKVRGTVVSWAFKKPFGFIRPCIPINHRGAKPSNNGTIFVHRCALEDEGVTKLRKGQTVEFYVYVDSVGLGAEECVIVPDTCEAWDAVAPDSGGTARAVGCAVTPRLLKSTAAYFSR